MFFKNDDRLIVLFAIFDTYSAIVLNGTKLTDLFKCSAYVRVVSLASKNKKLIKKTQYTQNSKTKNDRIIFLVFIITPDINFHSISAFKNQAAHQPFI